MISGFSVFDPAQTGLINPMYRTAPYQVSYLFTTLRPRNWKRMSRKQRIQWKRRKTRFFEKAMIRRVEEMTEQMKKNMESALWKKLVS